MADAPTYEQFFAKVKAGLPAADDGTIRSAYEQRFGKAARFTSGPSLGEFSTKVKAGLPGVTDQVIQDAYYQRFGEKALPSMGRGILGAFARGGKMVGGLVSGLNERMDQPGTQSSADEEGQSIYDFWNNVEGKMAPARAFQANPLDQPGLAKQPGFWAGHLGAAAGTALNPTFAGVQGPADLYGQGKLSLPKAIALGAVETGMNFMPFAGSSRLMNAGLGATLGFGTPLLEAAAAGDSLKEAAKAGLVNAPIGFALGSLSPGRQIDYGAAATDFHSQPKGPVYDPAAQRFMEQAKQLTNGAGPEGPPPAQAVAPPGAPLEPRPSGGGEVAPPVEPLVKPGQVLPPRPLEGESRDAFGARIKAYAKAHIDTRPLPDVAAMPKTWDSYFDSPGDGAVNDTDQEFLTLGAEAQPGRDENGIKRMAAAAGGEIPRRRPIDVEMSTDGKMHVVDGKSTLLAARAVGLKSIPIRVVPGVMRGMDSPAFNDLPPVDAAKLRETYLRAATDYPIVMRGLQDIAARLGGTVNQPALKSVDRAVLKIMAEPDKYLGKGGGLKDILRGTVVIDDPAKAAEAFAEIGRRFPLAEDGVNLFDPNSTPLDGYRHGKQVIVSPGGIRAEVQINIPAMIEAKGKVHGIYVERQKVVAAAEKAGEYTLDQRTQVMRHNAAMRPVYAVALNPGMWDAANGNSLAKSSGDLSVPRSSTPLGAGPSVPSGNTALNLTVPAASGGKNTTGVPSTSQSPVPNAPPNGVLNRSSEIGIGNSSTPIIRGRETHGSHELITPTGRQVKITPKIVELADLIHSQRPGYDQELQPRDRTRMGSAVQVDDMAQKPNLAKTKIVIDHAGQVLSGNGRTLAQLRMDEHYPHNAVEYTRQLSAAGHDITGFHRPVLVEQLTEPLDRKATVALTQEMNTNTQLAMSASETSVTDSAKIDQAMISLLHPGAIESAKNSDFVRAFLNEFTKVQQAAFTDSEGHLSAAGIRRINNAIMAKAYGGSTRSKAVLERAMESSDNEVRSITSAMQDAAPHFVELRNEIGDGNVPRQYDVTAQLTDAVERTAKMRADGRSLEETLGQADAFHPLDDLTAAWMRAFSNKGLTRAAGKPTITSRLTSYANQALAQDTRQLGMDTGEPPPSPLSLINHAIEQGAEGPPPATPDMFGVRDAEAPRRAYAGKRVQSTDGQLALDFNPQIETRPDTNARQVSLGVAAVERLLAFRDRNGRASVLAHGLTKDFTETGHASLIGRKVSTAADLAALAQVYRDPRFETLRFHLVKGDTIVDQVGWFSRSPGAVSWGHKPKEVELVELRRRMAESGADGYWMQHNHPAGVSTASDADINFTGAIANNLKGFRGHVIIDHNEYTHVMVDKWDPKRVGEQKHYQAFNGYHPRQSPTLPHSQLGRKVTGPAAIAQIAKVSETQPGQVTIITTDSQALTTGIARFPASDLKGTWGIARIKRMREQTGSSGFVFAIAHGSDVGVLAPLLRSGAIVDAVDPAIYPRPGAAYSESNEVNRQGAIRQPLGTTRNRGGLQVQAPEPAYGSEPPAAPIEPGQEHEIGGGTYKLRQFAGLEPEELRVLGDVVENLDPPVEAQRRGTRSWQTTNAASDKMLAEIGAKYGITLEQLVSVKPGTAANAETLDMYAKIVSESAKNVRRLVEEVAATGSNESKVQLAAARDKLGMFLVKTLGYATEAGRAMNILQKTAEANRDASLLLEALGDGSDKALTDFASAVRKAGNLDQVIGLTRVLYTPGMWDKFYEGWMSGLLSGPTTHARNMIGNAAFQALDLAADATAALVHPDLHMRAVLAKTIGMIHGIPIGLKNARIAFQTERPQIGTHIQTQQHRLAIQGTKGRIIRIPLRALMAEDEFFKAIAYHGFLAEQAMNRALAIGPDNVQERFNKILGDLQNDPWMRREAMAAADRATFQNDLGSAGKALQHMLEVAYPAKMIVPFLRTPTNILKQAIAFSPLPLPARLFHDIRAALGKPSGAVGEIESAPKQLALIAKEKAGRSAGAESALAYSRMFVGSALIAGILALVLKGFVTGAGPSDPKEREQLMRTGWKPHAIKWRGKYYQFSSSAEPFTTHLGMVADIHDIMAYSKPGEASGMWSSLLTSFALNLGDKTMLRGATSFAQAYSDPERYMENWLHSMAGTVVPNLAAQTAATMDPFARQVDTTIDAIKLRIPGMRETLAKKLDIAGQPITQTGDMMGNPFKSSEQQPDPIVDAMLRLSIHRGKPGEKLDFVGHSTVLTRPELDDYVQSVQQARWRALTPLVSSPQFQQAITQNPELAAKGFEKLWDQVGDVMKTRWIYQHPDVAHRLGSPKAPRAGSPYADQAAAP